jgi:integrase
VPSVVPTISKHGKGWRAQIRRLGHKPLSRTFPLKGQAWAWAEKVERELISGHYSPSRNTLGEAFDRYAREESPKKRGARWEKLRLGADPLRASAMAARTMDRLTATDIAAWRDARLRAVSGATVRREMNLIDSVLELARREWHWIATNPIRDVQKPKNPRSRRRRVRDSEVKALKAETYAEREVLAGFKLGIETGMRAGEMWSLERGQIKSSVAHLLKTKNGDERDVALSPAAVRIVRGLLKDGRERLFTITLGSRDALFREMRKAAGIEDLHFHDSRTEAIFRLSKKLDILELARQIGHRDVRSLMFYYEADAQELARKLASP